MKKFLSFIILAITVVIACCGSVVAYADEPTETDTQTQNRSLDEYSDEISSQLENSLDSETKQTLDENGVDISDTSDFSLSWIISSAWDKFTSSLTSPIRILGRLAAIILLSSAAESLAVGGVARAFSAISVLGCVTVIYQTVYDSFESVCNFLDTLSAFMMSYIPIYASVTAASGSYASGSTYYAAEFGVCELIAFVSDKVIMPFLSVFMALAFTAAINPDMKFSSAAESIKNAVRFTLTALMTVFTGLISVQALSGNAADNAAARAVKFGASNFIPIIGGSVSEAYSAVYASVGVIRAGVGTVGIIAAAVMLLKPLAELAAVKLVLACAKLLADLMGLSAVSELLKSAGFALSAAVSTLICFCMMFIISTAVIMLTAANL
jgi:stage III sporulation protein AE